MKKLSILLIVIMVMLVTGCTQVGKYKEGTYFGSTMFMSYGATYETTAVVYVDAKGLIKSCFIDSTYNKDGVNTTKKVLGDEYGMKSTSAKSGNIDGGAEWYEQIAVIEDKVVNEQGLDWVKWSKKEEAKLDSISGVTITADTYIESVNAALKQAKK